MSSNKKYIIISREGGDFSMDLIFAGLVRKFGKENVIDYPPRDKHRQGKPKLIGDHEKDYGVERRSLCYVDGCEDLKKWTRQEVLKELFSNNVECIFLDETNESYSHYKELMVVPNKAMDVVIAGHDNLRTSIDTLRERFSGNKTRFFIDDWQKEYEKYDRTHLINLSCNFDHLWDVSKREELLKNKIYDICFIGYNSNPARKLIIDHVKNKWGHLNNCLIFEERPNMFDKFVRHDTMFKLMAQSKICLNLPGASTSRRALRYYEIPYVGSYMLNMKTPTVYLHPYKDIDFDSPESFDKMVEFALNNPDLREKKSKQMHDEHMKYNTVDARINYIIEVLNG